MEDGVGAHLYALYECVFKHTYTYMYRTSQSGFVLGTKEVEECCCNFHVARDIHAESLYTLGNIKTDV